MTDLRTPSPLAQSIIKYHSPHCEATGPVVVGGTVAARILALQNASRDSQETVLSHTPATPHPTCRLVPNWRPNSALQSRTSVKHDSPSEHIPDIVRSKSLAFGGSPTRHKKSHETSENQAPTPISLSPSADETTDKKPPPVLLSQETPRSPKSRASTVISLSPSAEQTTDKDPPPVLLSQEKPRSPKSRASTVISLSPSAEQTTDNEPPPVLRSQETPRSPESRASTVISLFPSEGETSDKEPPPVTPSQDPQNLDGDTLIAQSTQLDPPISRQATGNVARQKTWADTRPILRYFSRGKKSSARTTHTLAECGHEDAEPLSLSGDGSLDLKVTKIVGGVKVVVMVEDGLDSVIKLEIRQKRKQ